MGLTKVLPLDLTLELLEPHEPFVMKHFGLWLSHDPLKFFQIPLKRHLPKISWQHSDTNYYERKLISKMNSVPFEIFG